MRPKQIEFTHLELSVLGNLLLTQKWKAVCPTDVVRKYFDIRFLHSEEYALILSRVPVKGAVKSRTTTRIYNSDTIQTTNVVQKAIIRLFGTERFEKDVWWWIETYCD